MPSLQELLKQADLYKKAADQSKNAGRDTVSSNEDVCNTNAGLATFDYLTDLSNQPDLVITEDTIKTLHCLICQETGSTPPGQYRDAQLSVSESKYTFADPDEIPRLMKHLTDQIQSSRAALHPIELAAMAHKRLMDIQPFSKENENTALLLMNLILANAGYCTISIPLSRRSNYLNELSISRKRYDMEPFSKFIAECVIDAELQLSEDKTVKNNTR